MQQAGPPPLQQHYDPGQTAPRAIAAAGRKVIHPTVEDNPDIVPKVHHSFGIRVVPVDSGQTLLCRITTRDYGRQCSRSDGGENADTVWVMISCSGQFSEIRQPAFFQTWDKDPGSPAVNDAKEHFLQGVVLKRIFMKI
jgi:hypothetical protein